MTSLDGKIIIVTGGSRGIGEATVRSLCADGARVYATYNIGAEKAAGIVSEISQAGGIVEFKQLDVTNIDDVVHFVEGVAKDAGRIDGLVNNAGITRDGLIMRMSAKDWADVISTNLSGAFYFCKAVSRQMMGQRYGRIVNIGSIVGLSGNAGQVNYSASKAGLVGLTKSLAKELASRNVLVNCVAPGYVETDMTGKLNEEQKQTYSLSIPLKRIASANEIAKVVAFLLSDDASYITGQVINVDGGLAI
jgi:3-oxoacyl-[acyl-carrier protein] reductase